MARKVVWTLSAARAKDEILLYWLERNKSTIYPRKLDQLFHQAARLISRHPLIGRKTPYPEVRSKLVRDYLLFYKFSDKQIEILVIWDGRQNPKDKPFTDRINPV